VTAAPGISLDVLSSLYPAGGIGRYVRDLCDILSNDPAAPRSTFVYPRSLRSVARVRYAGHALRELPLNWLQLRMLLMATMSLGVGLDALYGDPVVVHSPMGYGPLFSRARLVLTIHDLTSLEHPEWHPRRAWLYINHCVPRAAARASRIMCDSDHVRAQVIARFRVPAERVVTIPLSAGVAFRPLDVAAARAHVAGRFGIEGEFVLHVATFEPRKNHLRLLRAFELLRSAGYPGRLVLVGQDGWLHAPILRGLEQSVASDAILRVRDADDRDLAALYATCTLSAFPSIEEGFGLPVLESMACGAACVTSDHAALTELAGDGAWSVPATDSDALAGALIRLWREPDLRRALAARGLARAARYDRGRWRDAVFALYREELAAAASGSGSADAERVSRTS
jgi:glycosyltransferase involved in cell wall biosynthesis